MKGKKMNCELSCDFVILSRRMLGATQVIRVQVQWTNLNQVEHCSSWVDVWTFSFGFPFAWIGELSFLRRGGKQCHFMQDNSSAVCPVSLSELRTARMAPHVGCDVIKQFTYHPWFMAASILFLSIRKKIDNKEREDLIDTMQTNWTIFCNRRIQHITSKQNAHSTHTLMEHSPGFSRVRPPYQS